MRYSAHSTASAFCSATRTAPKVLAKIEEFTAGTNGWSWAPAPLLLDLVARNATFASFAR